MNGKLMRIPIIRCTRSIRRKRHGRNNVFLIVNHFPTSFTFPKANTSPLLTTYTWKFFIFFKKGLSNSSFRMSVPSNKGLKLGTAINSFLCHFPFKKHLYFSRLLFSRMVMAGCSWPMMMCLALVSINLSPWTMAILS